MKFDWKKEFYSIVSSAKSLDRKTLVILLSVPVLQTISWYLTSRQFFRTNFYYSMFNLYPDADLYEFIYWFLGDFITIFLLPVLIIKTIFRESIAGYGLNLKEINFGLRVTAASIMVMLPVIWIASGTSSFMSAYPLLESSKYDWGKFLLFQAFLLVFVFAWEFFWRGYMLFGLKKEFGYYSIILQMIPFVILHNGKPFMETSGAIFGGLLLGIIAFRTGSFLYGVVIHYAVLFFIDFFSILRFREGDIVAGTDSLFRIFSKLF